MADVKISFYEVSVCLPVLNTPFLTVTRNALIVSSSRDPAGTAFLSRGYQIPHRQVYTQRNTGAYNGRSQPMGQAGKQNDHLPSRLAQVYYIHR